MLHPDGQEQLKEFPIEKSARRVGRVGVFANMAAGLEQFVYRELLFFSEEGLSISLFPTRYNQGLYNAQPGWRLHRWRLLQVILIQFYFLFQMPGRYLQLAREAIRFRAPVDFMLAWYFSRYLDDVDVLYATFGDRKLFVAYFCKRITNKPLVVMTHAYELYENPNPRLFVHALNGCDQICTATEYNREYLHENFGVDPARVQVVRYSIDIDDYQPEEKFVVLIVSFFTHRKGHDTLLQAVKKLGRPDVEVWVVGDVAERKNAVDVRALVAELDMTSQVAFFGMLSGNALKAVYRSCDLFCLPSRKDRSGASEGFPNVLIEAMAMGKPVVSTRHVEIPRIIPEILVDENDVDGLAQAIEELYQSSSLRSRLGQQNREIVERVFSSNNARQMAAILGGLAS
jgi:colanic acid/amylovoran biosynthesis glycosyltransferase